MRVALIHNPAAGDEEHDRGALVAAIERAGHDVDYRPIDDEWTAAVSARPELVVVAGGDGTVGKVFRELAGSATPVAVIPLGSANNIAATLGLGNDEPEQLVASWPRNVLLPFDVCAALAPWGRERFVESAGGGILAEMLVRDEEEPADESDKVANGLELLQSLLSEAPALPWEVELDGADLSGRLLGALAMNIRDVGPALRLAPSANPGDGLLDVVLLEEERRAPLAAYVEARLAGHEAELPSFTVRRTHEVVLHPPAEVALHRDDDPWSNDGRSRSDGAIVLRAGVQQVNVLVAPPRA